jgi:hypothetical protein
MLNTTGKKTRIDTYFKVQASILDSKKSKGYRSSIYRCAQHCLAYFSLEGERRSIYYDEGSSDLSINLLFASREKAELFQNELLNFAYLHPHFGEKLRLDKAITDVEVLSQPERIFHRDYISSDNDESPEMSLNDILQNPSVSAVTIGNSAFNLQALEEERIVRQFDSKWYKCHFISATNKKYNKNPNNIMYASHSFHQLFDGLNTTQGVGVLVKFFTFGDEEDVLVSESTYEKRRKVIVTILFRDKDIATSYGPILKIGTKKIDDYSYLSFLYAKDGETMKYCLEQKYATDSWLENISSVSEE